MENALALAIKPPQIDVATPLMQAAQLRRAETQTRASEMQMRRDALSAEARGVAVYADKPEFGQKWAEMADRLRSQGIISPEAHTQWRNTPSPLLLRQIIASTETPQMALQRELTSPNYIASVEDAKLRTAAKYAGPKTANIKTPDGQEVTVVKGPNGFEVPKVAGMDTTPNNPYAPPGKMTDTQSKDALYANRMFAAEKVLRDPAVTAAATSIAQRGLSMLPGIGNFAVSGDFQKFDQAQRDFINAVLRRESGAVISEGEFENARKQYFPQPGDTQERIAQKLRNRAVAIKGITGGAGPSFRPDLVFGPTGDIVPNMKNKQTTPGKPAPAAANIPQQAADLLKSNPALREMFDAKYGPGSAAKVLGN